MNPRAAVSLLILGLCGWPFYASAAPAPAQVATVVIDASAPAQPPPPASYIPQYASSPDGHTLGLNSLYLTRDGRPWLPVMGEFHYARVPESQWREEILKMKAAGVQIVSTYVIWIHHEEVEGQFDWSGRRDLRRFVQLCGQNGLDVFVRVGPWAHGEARNGGLPDWILKKGPTRRNDPVFMQSVTTFFSQIGQQLTGLYWKDGGPILGVQLENEYSARGPGAGREYILALKKLAIASGLQVPFYTVTGWDHAVVPLGQVIPVFGGYPDAPWDAGRDKLPPNDIYMFRQHSRVAANMGAIGQSAPVSEADRSATPFITAEMGGGIEDTYHRRPVISADDIAAMMPVLLGSGVNLYGTYMFQGGQNPPGKLTTLQESQATGYPTDVPVQSYDFQAPLGEYGQERASFRKLKVFNYFLNDFGSDLAPMTAHPPRQLPSGPADFTPIRAAVRSHGRHGFLFVNNYVRGYPMPPRRRVQFRIELPGSSLTLPDHPVDIPSGAYFIWPFNLDLGPATLISSTAQLFTRLASPSGDTYFFEEIPGIPAEFVFPSTPHLRIEAPGVRLRHRGNTLLLSQLPTGLEHPITLESATGPAIRIILLAAPDAENAWKATLAGQEHLILTPAEFFAGKDAVVLRTEGQPRTTLSVYPRLDTPLHAEAATLEAGNLSTFSTWTARLPEKHIALHLQPVRPAGQAPPVPLGPPLSWRPHGVAMAPGDAAFAQAAQWRITLPAGALEGLSNLFLEIRYTGDVARLSAGTQLLDDNFYNGQPWSVGLKRYARQIDGAPLDLSILPLRQDAPIYLESSARPAFGARSQIVDLRQVTAVPEYQFVLHTGPAAAARP